MPNVLQTLTSGVGELTGAFHARREELMRGRVHQLWEIQREYDRVYLRNVSRDISVQEAWFTDGQGLRQSLGRVRPGERTELRAYRDRAAEPVTGRVDWRVRSMILPGRSISRSEKIAVEA